MPNLPSTAISRLLEQLSGLEDPRQQAKVLYPLPEICCWVWQAAWQGQTMW